MKNFISFNHKLYRNNLACDLKLKNKENKEEAKSHLHKEKTTFEYQMAKNIKVSVYYELKNILTTSNKLNTAKEENKYFEELDSLVDKVKNNYAIFNELPKDIQLNHYFNLKLLEDINYLYGNSELFPKELLSCKEFILKAIKVNTDIVRFIPNEAKIKSDFDTINLIIKIDFGKLINFDFQQYKNVLIKNYPTLKKRFDVLLKSRKEKLKYEKKYIYDKDEDINYQILAYLINTRYSAIGEIDERYNKCRADFEEYCRITFDEDEKEPIGYKDTYKTIDKHIQFSPHSRPIIHLKFKGAIETFFNAPDIFQCITMKDLEIYPNKKEKKNQDSIWLQNNSIDEENDASDEFFWKFWVNGYGSIWYICRKLYKIYEES